LIIIDAHEDLAWNALTFGRDYRRAMVETRRLEAKDDTPKYNGQALIGWPEWIKGRVGIVFSSLFSAPLRWKEGPWDTLCYDNPVEAHHHYQASLDVYSQWIEESPDKIQLIKDTHTLQDHWAAWQDPTCAGPVGFIMLMEGADGIREPAEVAQWFERGVRILGLSWSGTRYAGGTKEPGPLTDLGRELLRHMDACGMILDLSHLSEDGAREALDLFQGPVIASHTSFLARVPNAEFPERLLSEEMIRLIDIVAAIDYVCQLLGNANHIALGSDFDGGFGLDQVPMGLDSIADLRLIGDALQEYGYTPEDVEAIMGLNWYHLLQRSLPED
jgi:membrane dipeptidase